MDKTSWKARIISALEEIGMNKPQFSLVVDTLAEILEQRDKAFAEFLESGAKSCIVKTSDRGAQNISKNPQLLIWMDLNDTCLQYWKELCLSPASLKRLSVEAQNADKGSILEALLATLSADPEHE